jgi:hypothetical protein
MPREDREFVRDQSIARPRHGLHDEKEICRILLDLGPLVRRLRVLDCEWM